MDRTELHNIEALAQQARRHYITTRTEILDYLEDHIDSMGEGELKIITAMLIAGRILDNEEFQLYTGMHRNTVNSNATSQHVIAIKELITDCMLEDEPGGYSISVG